MAARSGQLRSAKTVDHLKPLDHLKIKTTRASSCHSQTVERCVLDADSVITLGDARQK